jgi:hypothetical protein
MSAAVDPDTIGIKTVDYSLAQKTTRAKKTDPVEPLIAADGTFHAGATVGEDEEGTIEFLGDPLVGIAVGEGDAGVNGVTGGKTLITRVSQFQALGSWNGGSFSYEHCPNAA